MQHALRSENFSTIIVNPNRNTVSNNKVVLTYHDGGQEDVGRMTARPVQASSTNNEKLISSQKLAISGNAPAKQANVRGKYASSVELSERIYNEQTSAMNSENVSLRTDSQGPGGYSEQQYYAHQGRKLVRQYHHPHR